MTLRRLVLLLCFAYISFPTFAQQSSAPSTPVNKDPQAVSVLNQALAAAGGLSALTAIQDVTGTGNITYSQPQSLQGTVTVRASGLDSFRVDATLPAGVRSQTISHGQMSVTAVDGTIAQLRSQAPASPSRIFLPYFLLAPALNGAWFNLSYKGLGQLDGRSVHDIQVQQVFSGPPDVEGIIAEYHTVDFFIDASTFQISMMQDTVPKHLSRQIFFSNYTNVSGILVPFAISEQGGGLPTWTIQLNQVTFNSGLQDSDFKL
jgi:outer membrane lipoprotein-sorting protein